MKIVDAYLVPILETAVAKHKEAKAAGVEKRSEEIGDDETLLDHLVNYTDGKWHLLSSTHGHLLTTLGIVDPVVLRDEVLNIMIAGRDTVRRRQK